MIERAHLAPRFLANEAKILKDSTAIDIHNAMIRPVFTGLLVLILLSTEANAIANKTKDEPTVMRVNIVKPIPPTMLSFRQSLLILDLINNRPVKQYSTENYEQLF